MAGEAEVVTGNEEVEDAAAQAAFDQQIDPGKVPTATPEPAQVKPEVRVAEPKPQPEYAQITKSELADLMAKAGQVDKAFGKIGGIERVLAQIQSAPAGQSVDVTDDDFADLRAEYPELAQLLIKGQKTVFGKLKGAAPDSLAIDKVVNDKVAMTRKELIDSHLDAIVGGDWVKEVNSPAYATWIATQPADIKALGASDSLRDASTLMRTFSTFKAKPTPKPEPAKPSARKQQLEAAISPKGTGAIPTGGPRTEEEAFEAVFNKTG